MTLTLPIPGGRTVTPKEWANQIEARVRLVESASARSCDEIRAARLGVFEELVRAAIAEERAACARAAEEVEYVHPAFQSAGVPANLRQQIAAAIRARP